MKKLGIFVLVWLVFAPFSAALARENGSVKSSAVREESAAQASQKLEEQKIEIRGEGKAIHDFTVEVAVTPEELAQGLMFRKTMPKDHGMLFVFGNEAMRTFWMKNTLIPLDIIFVDADGKIVKIHENAKPLDETPISSDLPVFAAIELNGGMAKHFGLVVGDEVRHDTFGNSSLN